MAPHNNFPHLLRTLPLTRTHFYSLTHSTLDTSLLVNTGSDTLVQDATVPTTSDSDLLPAADEPQISDIHTQFHTDTMITDDDTRMQAPSDKFLPLQIPDQTRVMTNYIQTIASAQNNDEHIVKIKQLLTESSDLTVKQISD